MALCVLTGDIVGSTDLTDAEFDEIQKTLSSVHKALANQSSSSYFDTYRGDGWQMAFQTQHSALRFALVIRASLRGFSERYSTRIGIATGYESLPQSDTKPPSNDTFINSGRALDLLPRDQQISFSGGGAMQAATVLADHISQDWTLAQARTIEPFLKPGSRVTQKSVAADLGISRQAVGQALEAAGYHVIARALRSLEEQVK